MAKQSESKQQINDAGLVLKELSALYPKLTTQLKKAADFVLDHPIKVALLSIRKAAEAAAVTPSTLTRLAQSLGYDRYNTFRAVFQEAVHDKKPPAFFSKRAESLQGLAGNTTDNTVLTQFASSTFKNLEHFFQAETLQNLQNAAPMIIGARKVYALGFRDTFACAYHFAYMGRIAFPHITLIRGDNGTLLSELAEIGQDDVVVVFGSHPYASETVKAIDIIRGLDAKIIAVTDSLRSPLAGGAEIAFTLKNDSPHFFPTLIPSIALMEALLAICTSLAGKEMVENINHFEENLRQLGGYYTDD